MKTVIINMFRNFLIIGLILNAIACNSQIDTTRKFLFTTDFYNIGVSYDRNGIFGEIGTWKVNELFGKERKYVYEEHASQGFSLGLHGLIIGSEYRFINDKFYIAPKLGYRINLFMITSEISMNYFTNFEYGGVYIDPSIGLYLWPFTTTEMYLLYGYNFSLTNTSHLDNRGHRISLIWNFLVYNRKYKQTKFVL